MSQELKDTVARYLRHLQNQEWEGARALFTADATVWNNNDGTSVRIDEHLRGLREASAGVRSTRYELTRQLAKPREVIAQHVAHVTAADGSRGRVNAAMYYRFDDGLIARVEEYRTFVPDTTASA
ncbi:nuclear transport factor 2 family protein [Lentzea sp. E54]|uniref:nuclear transport factor 2 family protein n=1 Tax=Lentzea xerophila TaxID=3435883 RepID=UPI003DA467B0